MSPVENMNLREDAAARAARWKTQAGLAWRALFPDSDMSDAPKYWQRRQRWNARRGTLGR